MSNNNISNSGDFSTLSPTPFATNHTEGFDNYALATPAPNNAILIEQNGNWVGVIDPTYTQGQPVGGFGNSPNAYRWRFGDFNNGEEATLVFDMMDFSNSINNEMYISFAHANANSWDNDRLQILASIDCVTNCNLYCRICNQTLSEIGTISHSTNSKTIIHLEQLFSNLARISVAHNLT